MVKLCMKRRRRRRISFIAVCIRTITLNWLIASQLIENDRCRSIALTIENGIENKTQLIWSFGFVIRAKQYLGNEDRKRSKRIEDIGSTVRVCVRQVLLVQCGFRLILYRNNWNRIKQFVSSVNNETLTHDVDWNETKVVIFLSFYCFCKATKWKSGKKLPN